MVRTLLFLAFLLLCFSSNLYSTLGLNKGASDLEIKKAFKQMSLKYHPDRNEDPTSAQKFQQIVKAYEVLKDPSKKQIYDLTGSIDGNMNTNRHHQNTYHYEQFNPFQGFEQMFRQFQEQVNAQRKRSYERSRHQHKQQQNIEDQYQVHQYIDEFGRIRTVMVKKSKGTEFEFNILVDLVFVVLLVVLSLIFIYAMILLCSDKKQKNPTNTASHPIQPSQYIQRNLNQSVNHNLLNQNLNPENIIRMTNSYYFTQNQGKKID